MTSKALPFSPAQIERIGKLRSAELLLRENGQVIEIRRAETPADYFATLDFERLAAFRA